MSGGKRTKAECENKESFPYLLFIDRQLPYVHLYLHCVNEWWLGLRLSRQQRAAEGFRANVSLRGQAKEALLHGESDCLDLHATSIMSTKQSSYIKCK